MSEAEEEILNLRDEVAMLRADLAGKRLTWTTERPTEPGWYWGRHPFIVDMAMVPVGEEDIARGGFKPGSQWAGPIPEPSEPAPETLA